MVSAGRDRPDPWPSSRPRLWRAHQAPSPTLSPCGVAVHEAHACYNPGAYYARGHHDHGQDPYIAPRKMRAYWPVPSMTPHGSALVSCSLSYPGTEDAKSTRCREDGGRACVRTMGVCTGAGLTAPASAGGGPVQQQRQTPWLQTMLYNVGLQSPRDERDVACSSLQGNESIRWTGL